MFIYLILILLGYFIIDAIIRFYKKMNRIEGKLDNLKIHFKEVEMRLNRIEKKIDEKLKY